MTQKIYLFGKTAKLKNGQILVSDRFPKNYN